MIEKFEVGKKYKGVASGIIFTCVYSGEHIAVLKDANGVEVPINHIGIFCEYVEYEKPRKGTIWVNIYPYSYSVWVNRKYADKAAADSAVGERIACVKVDWIEGQGFE